MDWIIAVGIVIVILSFWVTYRIGYVKGGKMVVKEWKATLLEEETYYDEDDK